MYTKPLEVGIKQTHAFSVRSLAASAESVYYNGWKIRKSTALSMLTARDMSYRYRNRVLYLEDKTPYEKLMQA